MVTEYTVGIIIVVTAAAKSVADTFIANNTDAGDTAAARLLNLSVPLSATGLNPPTHWGCNWVAMRPAMRQWLQDRYNALTPTQQAQIFYFNERTTTFSTAITGLGLRRIQPGV